MLTQVRKTRRRAALLTATACSLVLVAAPAVAAMAPTTGSGQDLAGQAWSVDLAVLTDDDAGVRHADGALRLAAPVATATQDDPALDAGASQPQEESGLFVDEPVTLESAAGTVTADVDAETPDGTAVLVDVRGRLTDQGPDVWTEWVPAGDQLPSASDTVQVRVTLVGESDAGPAVHGLTLTPAAPRSSSLQSLESPEAQDAEARSSGRSYKVFATREGLVGGTTANGHVIKKRDHFVALPSRRGLSSKGSGSYSVRVCAEVTGRCAYAPVWDVGPWNITDDYWNPSGTRQSWTGLPQGKPQAQAAYQDGHNGGRDGFDRKVANPAGIDLGDGTFWDGLGLRDNAWTTVTYLWTGSGPQGVVRTSGSPLTVRSGPGTDRAAVGQAGRFANVRIECTAKGSRVSGFYGTTDVWNRIGPGNWISDAYVNTGSEGPVAPSC